MENIMANTKLDSFDKQYLKDLREIQQAYKVENNGETTVVYRDCSNTVEFSLSVASPDEQKFRRKVGEFYARIRMNAGETVKMKTSDFYYMLENLNI
jgi:hypothetical protein